MDFISQKFPKTEENGIFSHNSEILQKILLLSQFSQA